MWTVWSPRRSFITITNCTFRYNRNAGDDFQSPTGRIFGNSNNFVRTWAVDKKKTLMNLLAHFGHQDMHSRTLSLLKLAHGDAKMVAQAKKACANVCPSEE